MSYSRLRKSYFGRLKLRRSVRVAQQKNTSQDAQKGQTSHPPNPGAPRRAVPRARPQGGCSFCNVSRFTPHVSRICRTPLADFFRILLDQWLLVRAICYRLSAFDLRPSAPCHAPYSHECFSSPRSIARDHAGDHHQETGRAVWVGRDGETCPDPLFPPRPQREIQPHVSPKNALGTRAGRGVVHRV